MSTGAAASGDARLGDPTADARRAALCDLIDDAGLYPPACLPLGDALARHRAVRSGPQGWLVARFLCGVDTVGAVADAVVGDELPWRLAVTVTGDTATQLHAGVATARDACERRGEALEQIEVRLPAGAAIPSVESVAALAGQAGTTAADDGAPLILCEPSDSTEPEIVEATLAAVRAARESGRAVGLKLRCGGSARVPSAETLAEALSGAATAGAPLKATAGLHHAQRHHDRQLGSWEHGFVNLLAAATLAAAGAETAVVAACLDDDEPDAFALDTTSLRWRDEHAAPRSLRAMRARLLRGVGSCNLQEPIDELTALGALPEGPSGDA